MDILEFILMKDWKLGAIDDLIRNDWITVHKLTFKTGVKELK